MIIWLILIDVALDNLWILLGEYWCWSLLGLWGLWSWQRWWNLWASLLVRYGSEQWQNLSIFLNSSALERLIKALWTQKLLTCHALQIHSKFYKISINWFHTRSSWFARMCSYIATTTTAVHHCTMWMYWIPIAIGFNWKSHCCWPCRTSHLWTRQWRTYENMISSKLCHNLNHSLQKNSHSLPLGRFCQERCLRLSDRNSILSDDNNLCLHNSSGSYGAPNANLLDFMFLLVDFDKVLCSSANELHQNSNASSREEYIHGYWQFCYRFIAFTFIKCI